MKYLQKICVRYFEIHTSQTNLIACNVENYSFCIKDRMNWNCPENVLQK